MATTAALVVEQKFKRIYPRTDLAKVTNSRANKTLQNVSNHCIRMKRSTPHIHVDTL